MTRKTDQIPWIGLVLLGFLASLPIRAETMLLKGAVVHTISGETLNPGDVLVKEGRIEKVEKEIHDPADETVNLERMHLYPGLIASGTSLGLIEIDAIRATRDSREVGEYTPDVQSWIAVNPDSELLAVARANGITHMIPVPEGRTVSGQSALMALTGWTIEEMTWKRPVALHLFWPSMELDTTPKEDYQDRSKWKSLDDQAKERARTVKSLQDFFADASAYEKLRNNAKDQTPSNPAWEGMLPFVRGEIPLVVHADELRQIKSALQWSENQRYRIIIAGGRDAWMLAEQLGRLKIPVIYDKVYNLGAGFGSPTGQDTLPYDAHFSAPAILHRAGVKVIFSEGLGGEPAANVRNLPYSAAQAVAFGLPQEEALKGITLYPAEIFGVADRLGSITPGRDASLIALDGPLLDIRSHLKKMWINGKETSLENRQTRLFDRYSHRPPPRK